MSLFFFFIYLLPAGLIRQTFQSCHFLLIYSFAYLLELFIHALCL